MRHVEQKPSQGSRDSAVGDSAVGDSADSELAEREDEVRRARLAFDRGLEETARAGTRAVRRYVTPVLWGVAVAGGALALFAIVRLARRRPAETPLVQVTISGIDLAGTAIPPMRVERRAAHPLLPVLGAAVARAVFQRFISGALDSSRLSRSSVQSNRLSAISAPMTSSTSTSSNGGGLS